MTAGVALALALRHGAALAVCHRTLAAGSRSFALAARLLPPGAGDRAAVLYTWCRRADDAIDLAAPGRAPVELARIRGELDRCYRGEPIADLVDPADLADLADLADPALAAFRRVASEIALPPSYPGALVDGLAMDVAGTAYATLDELHVYGYRVAGVVGLMMSHVLGVRDDAALRRAAHLGMAMQLTNIARDIAEDWQHGRLYLPDELLAEAGAPGLRARLGEPVAGLPRAAIARATRALLAIADRLYASGDRGIAALPWRGAVAVRAARSIYARIGAELARRGFDPLAGRAIVPGRRKAALALAATGRQIAALPGLAVGRLARRLTPPRTPRAVLEFPGDVLPV